MPYTQGLYSSNEPYTATIEPEEESSDFVLISDVVPDAMMANGFKPLEEEWLYNEKSMALQLMLVKHLFLFHLYILLK